MINKIVLIISLIICNNTIASELWSHKDWSLMKLDRSLYASSNGNIVHGHKLRLLFNPKNCQRNQFALSLSSSNIGVLNLKGNEINFKVRIDNGSSQNEKFKIIMVNKFSDNLYVALMSSEYLSYSYQKELKKGHKLSFEIDDKPQIENMFDLTNEDFSLNGFSAVHLKMDDYCLK